MRTFTSKFTLCDKVWSWEAKFRNIVETIANFRLLLYFAFRFFSLARNMIHMVILVSFIECKLCCFLAGHAWIVNFVACVVKFIFQAIFIMHPSRRKIGETMDYLVVLA